MTLYWVISRHHQPAVVVVDRAACGDHVMVFSACSSSPSGWTKSPIPACGDRWASSAQATRWCLPRQRQSRLLLRPSDLAAKAISPRAPPSASAPWSKSRASVREGMAAASIFASPTARPILWSSNDGALPICSAKGRASSPKAGCAATAFLSRPASSPSTMKNYHRRPKSPTP